MILSSKATSRFIAAAALAASASMSAQALACASIEVVSQGQTLPEYRAKGQSWVEGAPGAEYAVRIRNACPSKILAVVSVDGVNVLTGKTASVSQQGYIIEPYGSYSVKGWRKSLDKVASFYFTYPSDSYAQRTGRPDNQGVIGAAFFKEVPPPEPSPPPYILQENSPAADGMAKREARAAGAPAPAPASAPAPTLGTGHGTERRDSVSAASFERQSEPFSVAAIRYETREGLIANGVIPKPRSPNPFPSGQFVPDPPARP